MIEIPSDVYDQLEEIRQEGRVNMLDYYGVMQIANEYDMFELVVWLDENKKLYAEGIFKGFEPI